MAKLLPNRVSKSPDEIALADLTKAVENLFKVLGIPIAITDKDYKALPKIAGERKRVCDAVFAIMEQHPEYIASSTNLEEVRKDKLYFEFCTTVQMLLSGPLFQSEREGKVAGAELFNACSRYEDKVDDEVDSNDANARIVQAKLKAIPRKSSGPRGGSPAAPAS